MRKNLILSLLFALAVIFSFSSVDAQSYKTMFLRGTFNGWVGEDAVAGNLPYKMTKEGDTWVVKNVKISKGRHKYKFEVTGGLTWGKNWGKGTGKKGKNIRKAPKKAGQTKKGIAQIDTAFNDLKTRFQTGTYTFKFNTKTGDYSITRE